MSLPTLILESLKWLYCTSENATWDLEVKVAAIIRHDRVFEVIIPLRTLPESSSEWYRRENYQTFEVLVPTKILSAFWSDGTKGSTTRSLKWCYQWHYRRVFEVKLATRNCFLARRVFFYINVKVALLHKNHHLTTTRTKKSLMTVLFGMKERLSRNWGVNDISCRRRDEMQASLLANVTAEAKVWLFNTELWKINEFEWNSFEIRTLKYIYRINMYFIRDIRCAEIIINFQC